MFFGANVDKFYSHYIRPVLDEEKREVAKKYGDTFVSISDIREKEETHGLFNHPNDFGMSQIADRFYESLKELL